MQRAWLIYDGDCPFCSNYAQYLRAKDAVDELVLVDAREGGPLVDEVRKLPHDLNQGMVLKLNDRYYVGHKALNVLAILSDKHGAFSRLNRLLFNSPLGPIRGHLRLGQSVERVASLRPPLVTAGGNSPSSSLRRHHTNSLTR